MMSGGASGVSRAKLSVCTVRWYEKKLIGLCDCSTLPIIRRETLTLWHTTTTSFE